LANVVDAELVEDKGDEPVVPQRLSIGKIGGLNVRAPQENLPMLNLMIYGDSGVGKTLLAGTAAFVPELTPILFVDVEGGTLTLSHFDNTADIDVVRVTRWQDMQKVYDDLLKGNHPYKTIIIDSLTEMQKLAMNSQLGAGSDLDPGGNMPEFKDWHINTEQMRRLVRAFRDLPYNTIFTALSMDAVDPRRPTGATLKQPAFTKKLAGEIPAFFDILFYMYVKETKDGPNQRLICTDKTSNVVAKCRVQGVPQILGVDKIPTMEMIYDLLIRNPQKVGVASQVVAEANAQSRSTGLKRKQ
jgi:hypothetical protein